MRLEAQINDVMVLELLPRSTSEGKTNKPIQKMQYKKETIPHRNDNNSSNFHCSCSGNSNSNSSRKQPENGSNIKINIAFTKQHRRRDGTGRGCSLFGTLFVMITSFDPSRVESSKLKCSCRSKAATATATIVATATSATAHG